MQNSVKYKNYVHTHTHRDFHSKMLGGTIFKTLQKISIKRYYEKTFIFYKN